VQAQIKGSTMPVLEMILDPGEMIVSDHGELSWMTPNMQMTQTANTGGGGGGGLLGGLKRVLGGGSILLTQYSPTGGQGMVAFAAKIPGHIFPLEVAAGQGYLVHRHGWVCGTPDITPSIGFNQGLGGMLFGHEGFILQRLDGQGGTAWVELSGEVTTYDLGQGQSLMVHPGHVGVFQESVTFQMTRIPGIMNRYGGGDGHWLIALTGPGRVWLQSMPLQVLASSLAPFIEKDDGDRSRSVEGGIAGGMLGNILRGQ
jgi:uncharacterized protein (AIM24 family)